MRTADPDQVLRSIQAFARKRLLVGIPMEKDPRPGETIGNASLGYIHEFGSPAANIPARPHLRPGIEAVMPDIIARLRAGAEAALRGNLQQAEAYMGQAGQAAVNSVRRTIDAKIPPPLAQSTVDARRQRTPGSSYRRQAASPTDTTPLVDTGNYRNAITWVIREE